MAPRVSIAESASLSVQLVTVSAILLLLLNVVVSIVTSIQFVPLSAIFIGLKPFLFHLISVIINRVTNVQIVPIYNDFQHI